MNRRTVAKLFGLLLSVALIAAARRRAPRHTQ